MLASKLLEAAGNSTTPTYIEDVFSTYLYSGNYSTQNIVNGIDLAGKGGMVWIKQRSGAASSHVMVDTVRGTSKLLYPNETTAQLNVSPYDVSAFNSDGFSLNNTWSDAKSTNSSGQTYASWTFRKQPKFFTQGTYSGNGSTQAITHDLGSAPGFVIVKNITTSGSWIVWHRSLSGYYMQLNGTGVPDNLNAARRFGNNSTTVDPTSTTITVGDLINTSGDTWVYYAFAHNAGGFGLTGTDNVISCGSFTTNSSAEATINLGYEPQWLLVKKTNSTGNWLLYDNMREWSLSNAKELYANTSAAESNAYTWPTATGFFFGAGQASSDYIYIAIRRGPMKVPTDATKVFNTVLNTGNGATKYLTGVGFPPDIVIVGDRDGSTSQVMATYDKLRGPNQRIKTSLTDAEDTASNSINYFSMDGVGLGANPPNLSGGYRYSPWFFRRAPGFCDEVCYTGSSSALTLDHNLGVVPELIITKCRSVADSWPVWSQFSSTQVSRMYLYSSGSQTGPFNYGDFAPGCIASQPTSTQVALQAGNGDSNWSGRTFVMYLFASCPGVSKIGTYTGTGSTQTINCGFTGGARFVLIKRLDLSNGWYVWDTARGMVSGTDPYLLLHTPAAESNVDSVFTTTGGFQIAGTGAGYNANGGSYLYLAIA